MKTWTFTDRGGNREVISEKDLDDQERWLFGDEELATRVSTLLRLELCLCVRRGKITGYDVMRAIRHLEEGEPPSPNGLAHPIANAEPFLRPPLQGLWKKHFYSAWISQWRNIENELVTIAKEGDRELAALLAQPAHKIVLGALARRSARSALTGEWIIFVKAKGTNFYLSLGRHRKEGEQSKTLYQARFDRIMKYCTLDFPELPEWLI